MPTRQFIFRFCLLLPFISIASRAHGADQFDSFLKPLFTQNCIKCHGEKKVKGKVNLKEITLSKQFLARPKLIKELIEVIDANDMPPEDEPGLKENDRARLLMTLKSFLRDATAGISTKKIQLRRLNRFQYNNAIRDLFRLKRDVFALSEKLMTRQSKYVASGGAGRMPERVNVVCHSPQPLPGFKDVNTFPKDLRASHGFDNQANQLTLSPLLLDAFLKLSVSIMESPDFNEGNVGIWNDFFRAPGGDANVEAEVRKRLEPFMKKAFRSSVDPATLNRYVAYTTTKIKGGMPFTDSMKKVTSAILSSPMFLYRYSSSNGKDRQISLASNLSFFLWASGPDDELLRLAESGELSKTDVLNTTIDRMFADPKIERFLDTFPAQWMQLENLLAVTPDPKKARLFSIDRNYPASRQMILEPLLLFDAVFIEDRPIVELIKPTFSYQSEFMRMWYTSDLKAPKVDGRAVAEQNRKRDEQRKALAATIKSTQAKLGALINPVRERLLNELKKDTDRKPVDLKPYAVWEFNDLKESVRGLNLKPHGKIQFKDGMVVLNKSYLLSKELPVDLKAKTLEVWCMVSDINQQGGGVMGIQGPGDFFDTIVLGERKRHHWISGSNGFSRTLDFPGSTPEKKSNVMLHLAMVYKQDGTTTLYRNGQPYGKPYRKGAATFRKNSSSVIFGLRHLPPGGNKYLTVTIDKARLYDRALTAAEVTASSSGLNLYISDAVLTKALTPEQKAKRTALTKTLKQTETALKRVPKNLNAATAQKEADKNFANQFRAKLRSQSFNRIAATDPRYGGVITNAAIMSMTSGPKRTHPIARGAWLIEVILNDPPPPPPNDVPPLNENSGPKNLTIRERFVEHRKNPDCAGCHSRLDPLGFALENFDITGRWRDKYENGRDVDMAGTLMKKHRFDSVVQFKDVLAKEDKRFAKAFTGHLLRFALSRELGPADVLTIEGIVGNAEKDNYRIRAIIREIIRCKSFLQSN